MDDDGLDEHHKWDRKPFEAVFRLGQDSPRLRVIPVYTKSKMMVSVVGLYHFRKIALANRKKLVAQAGHLIAAQRN